MLLYLVRVEESRVVTWVKGDPSQDRFLVSIAASDGMRRRHGENRRYNHNVARYDTSRKFRFRSSLTDQQLAHFDLTHLGTIIFHRERSLTASPNTNARVAETRA